MSAAARLLAALRRKVGADFSVEGCSHAWASATFTGERHDYRLAFEDPEAGAHLLDGLAEHEFDLPGHLVADIIGTVVEDCPLEIAVEALTIALA